MTEFWKSNAKHYCKYCKVWMQGDKISIKNHEQGKRHREVMFEFKKEQREAKRGAAMDERELQKQLRDIERAAAAAVDQDMASGAVRFSAATCLGTLGRLVADREPVIAALATLGDDADQDVRDFAEKARDGLP